MTGRATHRYRIVRKLDRNRARPWAMRWATATGWVTAGRYETREAAMAAAARLDR